ncbi:SMI1/KNR4 family protein [Bacillus sp. OTU2372]|uniref:SMI1/KNR4 family protein n=1 Tax=Bacillus sp. OTU2372 TaxID=3043858 RepID=UPI00313B9CB0
MELIKVINSVYQKLSSLQSVKISEIKYEDPISEESLFNIETKLSFRFPETLRQFYLNQSSSLLFYWEKHNDTKFPLGEECKYGGINLISPFQILELYIDMKEMVDDGRTRLNDDFDEGWEALVDDWSFWIPIIIFRNGDAFCIDKRNETIVCLEHDVMDGGPNVHGILLALNFDDLIKKWSNIGFVEIFDWTNGVNEEGIDVKSIIYNRLFHLIINS